MSYHWFKKMLLSTSILILSSSSLGLATHTVEAKDNLNGEKPTTNLKHNITSPSVNSEMNNNETGTPHESNQTGDEGTGSNSRDANPDSNNVKPDSNNQNPNPNPKPDPDKPKPDPKPDPDKPKPNPDPKPDPDKPKPNPDPKPDPDKSKPNPDPKPDPDKPKPNPNPKPDPNKPNPNPSPDPNQPGIPINLVARKWGHGTQMLQMDLIKVNGNQMEIKETYKILLVMILYPNDFSLGEWGLQV